MSFIDGDSRNQMSLLPACMAVLDRGELLQIGAPADVARAPVNQRVRDVLDLPDAQEERTP